MFAKILCLALLGFALIQTGSSQRRPSPWHQPYLGAPYRRPVSWQSSYVGPGPYYPPHPAYPVSTVEQNTLVVPGFFAPLIDMFTEILRLLREFSTWITWGYITWTDDVSPPYRPIVGNRYP